MNAPQRNTCNTLVAHEPLLQRLLTPPHFEDESAAAAARIAHATGWTLCLLATPALLFFAWFQPQTRMLVLQITAALFAISVVALVFTYRRHPTQAFFLLIVSTWLLFTWIIARTGGLHSVAAVSLLVAIAVAWGLQNWRWGLLSVLAGVATVTVLLWATWAGLIDSSIQQTDLLTAAAYAACFIAFGGLQALFTTSVRRARDRAEKESEQRRAAERRLHDVVENAPFGALVAQLTEDDLRIVHANQSASEVLGTDASEFVGCNLSEAFRCFAGEDLPHRIGEIAHKGGHLRLPSVPYGIENRDGMLEISAFQIAEGSMAVFLSDVTERHRAETQIRQMAFHDELTELPNRKLFLDRLEVALAGARRRKTRVALFFLDLDDFKPVNDSYGHAFGDRLLRAVAERLSSLARASDTVARLGGDEFTVLIPDIEDDSQLEAIADKFCSAFQEPFRVESEEVTITASIGVAATRNGTTNAATLFEHADMAMYRVKRAGRDGCAFYRSRV